MGGFLDSVSYQIDFEIQSKALQNFCGLWYCTKRNKFLQQVYETGVVYRYKTKLEKRLWPGN